MPHQPDYYRQFLIYEGRYWGIYLYVDKSFTCYLGRIYILSRRNEDTGKYVPADIDDLSIEEFFELYSLRASAKKILTSLFNPDLFNWEELQNVTNHPHGHLTPRYSKSRKFNGQIWIDELWGKPSRPCVIRRTASKKEKIALLEVLRDAFKKELS